MLASIFFGRPPRQGGAAIVECAVVLPALLLLCSGLLSLASFLRSDLILERALRKSSLELASYDLPAGAGTPAEIDKQTCNYITQLVQSVLASEGIRPENYLIQFERAALSSDSSRSLQQISLVERAPGSLFGVQINNHSNSTAVMPYCARLPINCEVGG